MTKSYEHTTLIPASGDLWEEATRARFLTMAGDGTLPEEAFHRWLVQDYLFASGLTVFQAVTTARTPRPSQKLLILGLSALDSELDWFEDLAVKKHLDLRSPRHPVCSRYVDFLIASAHSEPFEVLLAILYGVEVSYLAGWSALEKKGPYVEFIERWSNPQFADYVKGLSDLCTSHPHPGQQDGFDEVLRHEKDFWTMTTEG